jgi:hypothetical protein
MTRPPIEYLTITTIGAEYIDHVMLWTDKRLQGIRYTRILLPISHRRFSRPLSNSPHYDLSCFNLSGTMPSADESSLSFLSWPMTTSPRPSIMCSTLTLGPLNHLRADTNHQIVTRSMGPP